MKQADLAAAIVETATSASWDQATADYSVLVSTFRRPHYLAGLFDSIEAQDFGLGRFEVIVADNASGDTTWEILRARAEASALPVCVARVAANEGPSSGRNAAASLARAPVVLFSDDDCLLEPQWVREMARAFDDGARLVQGRTAPTNEPRTTWDHTIDIRGTTALFETCNVGYRRDDVVAAGGFHALPDYQPGRGGAPFGGEDTMLGWEIVRATGESVTFAPDAVVHHRIEPRDYQGWLRFRRGAGIFPALLRAVPELRRDMFLRVFLSARSAAFDLAVLSVVVAVLTRRVIPLAGLLPYLTMLAPRRRGLRRWARLVGLYVRGDAATAWSLARNSLRQRRLVL
jgi:glycosyltransferase involved in cell wall biosynthesis